MLTPFRGFFAAIAVIGSIACAPVALAQTPGADGATSQTMRDKARTARQKLDDEAKAKQDRIQAKEDADLRAALAVKKKRAACGRQADEQKLHLLKRRRFIKHCMAS